MTYLKTGAVAFAAALLISGSAFAQTSRAKL